jgi:hypothetical protein
VFTIIYFSFFFHAVLSRIEKTKPVPTGHAVKSPHSAVLSLSPARPAQARPLEPANNNIEHPSLQRRGTS